MYKRQDTGYEGVVVKDPDARYGRGWAKHKRVVTTDAMVVGYNEGMGKYHGTIGSLALAVIDSDTKQLRMIAAASPGTDADRAWWRKQLWRKRPAQIMRDAHIVEVIAQQWTPDGRLRHPNVLRRRDDRSTPNVVKF